MTSRIRKNSKKLKRSLKKNKYIGGLTSMSGLHAFFVNKAEWIESFGEVVKDKDAPSIKNIEDKLKGKGYYIENNGYYINLIGVNGSKSSSSYEKHFLQSACYGRRNIYICHAAKLNDKFYISSDISDSQQLTTRPTKTTATKPTIQDVFGLIYNHTLFSNIVRTVDDKTKELTFSIVNNPLNIDYCVVIDVSRVTKNIFIKSVDYVQNDESTQNLKKIVAEEYSDDLCAELKKKTFGYEDPIGCKYTLRNKYIS
jgi:hypothetical protein